MNHLLTPQELRARTLVLIPVYNHGKTLRSVVESSLKEGYPVLVVDDGSTDGSLESVADLPITRHRLPENRGKGAAIQAGARLAESQGYSAVITIDADGQHDPADAWRLIEAAAPLWPAIVLGARKMDGENVPSSSRFGMAFSNFWVRLETGKQLPDTQTGYRIYPTSILTRHFISRRYTFEIEVLARASWAGLNIVATPISVYYPPREERVSHFRLFKDNLRLTALHTWLVTLSLLPWSRHTKAETTTEDRKKPIWYLTHPTQFIRRLCQEHSTPGELATAVWLGVFLGAMPIIPFGIAAILYVCQRLHLNKLAAAGASNICIAPFVPFLCIETGYFMQNGTWWKTFNWQTIMSEIHLRLWEWFIGAWVIGTILGSLSALATYLLVSRIRSHQH